MTASEVRVVIGVACVNIPLLVVVILYLSPAVYHSTTSKLEPTNEGTFNVTGYNVKSYTCRTSPHATCTNHYLVVVNNDESNEFTCYVVIESSEQSSYPISSACTIWYSDDHSVCSLSSAHIIPGGVLAMVTVGLIVMITVSSLSYCLFNALDKWYLAQRLRQVTVGITPSDVNIEMGQAAAQAV